MRASPLRLTPLRELQLVEAHRRGGPAAHAALSELVRAYQRRVYSICYRMVRNLDDASDLTQDALLKMIEGLGTYNGQSKLSTWVIRVTMNCCLSHLRKQRIREHKSLDASAEVRPESRSGEGDWAAGSPGRAAAGSAAVGREPSPAQSVEQAQMRSALVQALDNLDADMRAILVLRDLQELDYQQLAEVLEIPIGTVKSRLFRARAALRAAIEAKAMHHER